MAPNISVPDFLPEMNIMTSLISMFRFVSVYPEPNPQLLPTLPMLGHWHERDFIAAVATAPRILNAKNQKAETDDFLRAAIRAAITVLR
jgi:hypothetical protein